MTGAGEHFVAMADFDFTAGSDSEISFEAGDEIRNLAHFPFNLLTIYRIGILDYRHTT